MTFEGSDRAFEVILYTTLRKLIGLRSLALSGFATFGIRTTAVSFQSCDFQRKVIHIRCHLLLYVVKQLIVA